jgi:hypothetical protein
MATHIQQQLISFCNVPRNACSKGARKETH